MRGVLRGALLATLLGAAPCLPREAAATPLAPNAAATALDTADEPDSAFSGDDWDRLLSIGDSAFGLPIAPAEEGLRQVTRSLQDNRGLQQVLGDTEALRTPEPSRAGASGADGDTGTMAGLSNGGDGRSGTLPDLLADTSARKLAPGDTADARARPQQQPNSDTARAAAITAATGPDDDAETLRDAIRGLVDPRRIDAVLGSGAGGGGGDPAFGLGQAALESRLLGQVLDAFVHRTDGFGFEPTFSVFGFGQFSFNVNSETHNIEFTDNDSGLSLTLGDGSGVAAPPSLPPPKIDIVAMVWAFLASPTGTLSMIAGSVVLVIWGMARMASVLRR